MSRALRVDVVATPGLGDRSYVVDDGRTAVVVDPQRDIDRIQDVLAARSLTCAAVVETHIHNDYVTGGLALAREWGADYVVNREDPVRFDRLAVSDGEMLGFGDLTVEVLATPGHTRSHLAYHVSTGLGSAALFSGGSLLHGSVGRTDLVDPSLTVSLAHDQFHSVRRLAELPPETLLLPTHGFGSFCSAGATAGASTCAGATVGDELRANSALTCSDQDAWVAATVGGLSAYPTYYPHMAPLNLAGPVAAQLGLPPGPGPSGNSSIVVDVRQRRDFAAGHLPGSLGFELSEQFATYVGWLLPWGTPLTLVADDASHVLEARRQLARIGVDDLTAVVGPPASDRTAHYRVATLAELASAQQGGDVVVLDVRSTAEHQLQPLPRSHHIELPALPSRIDEIPAGEIWVHCASGYRASIAASLLSAAGRRVVLVDDHLR